MALLLKKFGPSKIAQKGTARIDASNSLQHSGSRVHNYHNYSGGGRDGGVECILVYGSFGSFFFVCVFDLLYGAVR